MALLKNKYIKESKRRRRHWNADICKNRGPFLYPIFQLPHSQLFIHKQFPS